MWKKIAETSFSQIIIIILALINSIIINRILGPAGKGQYAYILLISMTAAMILESGFTTGLSYNIGKKQQGDANQWKSFAFTALLFWLIASLIFIVISYLLQSDYLFILIPAIFFMQISTRYLTGIFLGENRIKSYNLLQIAIPFIQLICLTVIIMRGMELTPFIAAVIYGISLSVNVMSGMILIMPFSYSLPGKKAIVRMMKYSFFVYITNLISFLNYRIDMFIVKIFLPFEYLGFYSVGVFFIEKVKIFATSSSLVNFSYKINIMDRGDELRNIRIINSVNTLIAMGILALGYPLIWVLYSAEYSYAYWPMIILAPAIIMNGSAKMFSSELSADGIVKHQFIAGIISVILNIGLNFLLIPRIDILGAAVASLISYAVNMIIIARAFIFLNEDYHWRDVLFVNRSDIKHIRSHFAGRK
ncbi:MAG: oligosaccharide flippase family protein [candidate division WOR-3 bacterium]|nr:oligosaccharide flippase family protein [candidate division WOR-3 bacterium]